MLILLLFICLIVVVGVVAGLGQAGMLPGFDSEGRGSGSSGVSRMLDSPGCLLTLIAASVVWFAAWGVVLVLSLRFLRSVI
ncbi:MAG TPA: hypothetical protein VMZ51_03170 [Acidimicrobiales bacterium]|nr:hypothetical protein [Acidimicrobiales bacterium]